MPAGDKHDSDRYAALCLYERYMQKLVLLISYIHV